MKAKAKGSRNEHKTIRLLEGQGYSCVRSAASLGTFDVWCASRRDFVLVQVKSNAWPGSVEMEKLKKFVVPSNTRRLVHRWLDRSKLPDVREL